MRLFYTQAILLLFWGYCIGGYCQKICKYEPKNGLSPHRFNKTQLASEAQIDLMNRYDLRFAWLNLSVEHTATTISGNTLLRATALQALDTFAFQLSAELTIDSVLVNGVKSNFFHSNDESQVFLSNIISVGQTADFQIYYHGTPTLGSGIFNETSPTWQNQVTYTLSEPYGAFEWWPSKQILHDKLDSVYVFITTSNINKVGSNGTLTATVPLPANKVRYEWKCRYPIDYYLVSFAVAQYVEYSQKVKINGYPDSVLFQNFIYDNPQTLIQFQSEIDKTPAMLRYFSDIFGVYPFSAEKYGHKMAPISGGMEHQTMTTLGFFDAELVAHELAHQWFGDHVTCASWIDLWLNEGFASYAEILYNEHFTPANLTTKLNDVFDNAISKPDGSVYVTDTLSQNRLFSSRLTYNKASAVIHTLRFMLNNDSLFFAVLQNYQQQFRHSVATTEDFIQLVEQMTAKSWQTFFQQWIYGEGYPSYSGRWNSVADTLWIELNQFGSTINPDFFDTDLELRLSSPSKPDTIVRIHHAAVPTTILKIPFQGTVSQITTDPKQWILDKNEGFYIDPSFGITSREADSWLNWRIFPNPAKNYCTLEFIQLKPETQMIIHDLTGKIVKRIPINELQTIIPLDDIPPGTYLVEVKNQSYSQTQKLVLMP